MNAYRANAGLPELVVSDTVIADARAWSKHMSDSGDFSHDPDCKYFGVGVHIAKHGNFTRVYGTQKFYAITGGSPNVSRFHTTGDTASAYGFDGAAFSADNTNYVSGLAGGGDAQRANSWQDKVGALPGVALPVDVSSLPAKAGSAAPSTSTPTPDDTAPSADRQQAVIDAQASVNAAQAALDEYLASAEESKPATSLADIDAELDRVA